MNKKNSMKFALLSTASLLSSVAPPPEMDENQTRTQDGDGDRKPQEVFSLWDEELSKEGDVSELLRGFNDTYNLEEKSLEAEDSVAVGEESSLDASAFSKTGDEAVEETPLYSIDGDSDSQIESYYRFLGELMFKSGGED